MFIAGYKKYCDGKCSWELKKETLRDSKTECGEIFKKLHKNPRVYNERLENDEIKIFEIITTNPWYEDVIDFHNKFGQEINYIPLIPESKDFRFSLIREKVDKLLKAMQDDDLVSISNCIVNCLNVIIGTSLSYGLPLDELWEEIHKNNMGNNTENTIVSLIGKILGL